MSGSARGADVPANSPVPVALTTGARVNPLAALLIWRLREAGHRPVAVLSTAPAAGLARLAKARSMGWAAVQRRLARRGLPTGPRASGDATAPIDEYARQRGYPSPWQPLPAIAREAGVAVLRVGDLNGAAASEAVRRRAVRVVVNAGGGLFRRGLLEAVPGGILNAHMGPLPRFRGMNALEWSLLEGAPPTVSLHLVAAGIDTGDVIAREPIPRREGDGIAALRARYVAVAVELVAAHLGAVAAGTAARQAQRRGDGRQYFAMHPRLAQVVEARLGGASAVG